MKIPTRIANLIEAATLENAIAWAETSEQTLFVVEYLEVFTINTNWFDQAQDELEARFEELLA